MSDLTDLGQVASQATPGTLLRNVVEAQAQDPSKIPASAQIGSAIRNLVQEPQTSTLPSTTPRVLNVVGPQSPTADFSGLHDLLAAAPVPPPHVAAALIRALMTPPSSNGVVRPQSPAPQISSAPASTPASISPSQGPSGATNNVVSPVAPRPASPAPVQNFSRPSLAPASPAPSTQTFGPAPTPTPTPTQTRSNQIGITPFIGGSVGLQGLKNLGSNILDFLPDALGGIESLLGGGLFNLNTLRNSPLGGFFGGGRTTNL